MSEKRAAIVAFTIISLGLIITWMGYFFHFQSMSISQADSFKQMFMSIATFRMPKIVLVAFIIGSVTTLVGFIYLLVSLRNDRENLGLIFSGSILLLSSFPILHAWGNAQPTNFNGPACISIMMNLFGWILVSVGFVRLPGLEKFVASKKVWIWMNILFSLGVFLGSTFLIFGSLSAVNSRQFSAGTVLLILSLVALVSSVIVGIVAYAKSKHHAWELETIIERQKDIRKLKQLQRTTIVTNV
jgi:hypothetical protein